MKGSKLLNKWIQWDQLNQDFISVSSLSFFSLFCSFFFYVYTLFSARDIFSFPLHPGKTHWDSTALKG